MTNNNQLTTKITTALEGIFDSVVTSRKQYFIDNPSKRPSIEDVDSIIRRYANQNAVIAGAGNLIPGPLGLMTSIPELIIVIRNQIQMIYDLGVAHGKEAKLNEALLLAIFVNILDGSTLELFTIKGSELLLKKASLAVIQRIILWLGGNISQKLLQRMLAKWLPVAGATAMVLWSRQSTIKMGREASKLLAMNIVNSEEEVSINDIPIE